MVLGIDTRKFDEGQRNALAAFKKTREGAADFAKDLENQGAKLADMFGIIKKGALGIVGAFVGGEAAAFINTIAAMDATTGRMAKTIDTSVENLSTWQGMIRQVGGSAENATAALSAMQDQIEKVRRGEGMFSEGTAFLLNKIGGAQGKSADTILRQIQGYLSGEVEGGRMTPAAAATALRSLPGMNQDMVNLMLSSARAFREYEDAARRAGTATKESAEAAQDYQRKTSLLTQSLENLARYTFPLLTEVVDTITKAFEQDAKDIQAAKSLNPFKSGSWFDRLDKWQYKLLNGTDRPDNPAFFGGGAAAPAAGGGAGGQSRGDRNNNPGNIEFGPFARAHGATGSDGRFAIFPDKASGESAMADLLMRNYTGLTLAQIQQKWVGNADAGYLGSMSSATGLGPGEVPNLSDPAVRAKLIASMARGEGSHLGATAAAASRVNNNRTSSNTTTTTTNINKIEVNAPNATDAAGIAKEIAPQLKLSALTSPANSGLV